MKALLRTQITLLPGYRSRFLTLIACRWSVYLGYTSLYDATRQVPAVVGYAAWSNNGRTVERLDEFFEPVGINAPSHHDFTGIGDLGFVRGHLAPARLMGNLHAVQGSNESFSTVNVMIQKAEINRGIWRKIEGRSGH